MGKEFSLDNFEITIPNNLRGAKVCDLMDDHGEWRWIILQSWMPEEWLDKLQSCLHPYLGKEAGVFCVVGTDNAEFSKKNLFNFVIGFKNESVEDK